MTFRRLPSSSTCVAIGTLGLALAAVTAIFSALYAVVLAPLPYRDVDRIVQVNSWREGTTVAPGNFSLGEVDDVTAATRTLDDVAAFAIDQVSVVRPGDAAEALTGAMVSDNFFALLGTTPRLGRYLDASTSTTPVAIISERVWRTRFGADPATVGRALQMNGRAFVVAGVAPASFRVPNDDVDAWIPLAVAKETAPPQWGMRGFRSFEVLARLKSGVSIAAARQDADTIAREWRTKYPRFSEGMSAVVTPLTTRITGSVAPVLWLFASAGACVLLIACANLVNLLLARNVTRAREYAVRVALGATRAHLLRLAWSDALGIASAGGVVGVALAWVMTRALTASGAAGLPRAGDIAVSSVVIAFAIALVLVIATLVGLIVGLRAWRAATTAALGDARTRSDRRSRRLHSALVVIQVALSLALVVNASLLLRSLSALMSTSTGASNRGVITMKLSAVGRGFLDRALPRIGALPGVRAAGVISSLPPNGSQMRTSVSVVSPATGSATDASVDIVSVSPGALEAIGVQLVAGRFFTDADLTSDRRSMIISVNTAERLFLGIDPIGRPLPFGPQDSSRPPQLVVGVVSPVRYDGLEMPADGAIYVPYTARPFAVTYLAVLTDRSTSEMSTAVRAIVRDVDATQAVSEARVLGDVIRASIAAPRLRTQLISALAIVALAMSAMGLYAVMSHAVGTRVVEMAVRMALGATGGMVQRQVVFEGATLALGGLLCGVPIAYVGARVASRYLIVTPDVPAIAAAVAVLVCASLAAAWLPARRASRSSPMDALRS